MSSAIILPIDVEDVGDSYHFIADVPGLEKGDIKVSLRLASSITLATAYSIILHSPCPDGSLLARLQQVYLSSKSSRCLVPSQCLVPLSAFLITSL